MPDHAAFSVIVPSARRELGRGTFRESGQSTVELAIILPIMLILVVGLADFARLIATTIAIESAAREAADYGTLYPWLWDGSPSDPTSNYAKTVAEMQKRACLATKDLVDYLGPDHSCTNPVFAYTLDASSAGVAEEDCPTVPRASMPCDVRVSLTYVFRVLVPLNFRIMDFQVGFPSTVTISRSSVFAISDFAIDEP
jgi:Flp pilus assembly protein TadG